MADEAFTKADIDKAVAEAVGPLKEQIETETAKNAGLLDDLKKAQRELRSKQDVKPEDLHAAEERAEKAETALDEANKQVKALTAERDKAVKSLETEQAAARSYALDAELAGAIAEGNVIPSLIPGFKAMMATQAKADLVDGKYSVTIGDKPARDAIKAMLESEDGKAWRAAPHNSGGGAPGGNGGGSGAKTVSRAEFDAMTPAQKVAFGKEGGRAVDVAA